MDSTSHLGPGLDFPMLSVHKERVPGSTPYSNKGPEFTEELLRKLPKADLHCRLGNSGELIMT